MLGRSPGLEWRYSFSQAEIILCQNLPSEARTAFVTFKAMVKKHINSKLSDTIKISSYSLKCILFRVVESRSKTFWKVTDDRKPSEEAYV